MPSSPLHPMLAPLLRGGAVPGRWLAEVRDAGDWAERFVNEGWDSLQALRAVSYSALLASPLGEGSGALAAALTQLEDGVSELAEAEATAPHPFDDPAERRRDLRDRSRQPADRLAPAGRKPPLPLPPPSPSGPISAAMAAARLAQRAAAAGLEPAPHPGLEPQSSGRRGATGAGQALTLAAGWHHVVGFARQPAAAGTRAPLLAGEVQIAARSMPDPVRPVTIGAAAMRFADAVERALSGASSMPSVDRRARARVAAPGPSGPAAAARGRPGAEPVAPDQDSARGEPLAVASAGRPAARAAGQGPTGLRGLAERAAAAGFDDPIEGRRRASVVAVAAPEKPSPDEARLRPEHSASPAALDDEQLAAQLTRVLRREAERDGVDIDDVLP